MEKILDDEKCIINQKGSIFYLSFKEEIIELNIIRHIIGQLKTNTKDSKNRLLFFDFSNIRQINHEAREYFSHPDLLNSIKAACIFVNTPVGNIIGNFLIKINKPPYPLLMFNNKAEAENWIKQFN